MDRAFRRRQLLSALRVAIVHDYLNQRGGAERVVARIHRLFPDAPIHTSILDRDRLWPALSDATIIASWMQHIPGIHRHFKKLFWLYPLVFERMNLTGYDLDGNEVSLEADELTARLFQHELDHLDGRLLLDLLDEDQRKQAMRTMRERLLADPTGSNGHHAPGL